MNQRRLAHRIIALSMLIYGIAIPIQGRAQDYAERPHPGKTLQSHIMASGLSATVVQRFSSIVPQQRMMYLARTGQLLVYAEPELQRAIADRIRLDPVVRVAADRPSEITGRMKIEDKDRALTLDPRNADRASEHQTSIRSLPLPDRPVQIIHLKELDLLIIMASN
ncbi:MAG: hypothetical protein KDB00_20385 [Planctomycetales bacterium]|nr:hypothetical protein [Planctomycetales bacterium]